MNDTSQYFSALAADESFRSNTHDDSLLRRVVADAGIHTGDTVLDVGCGTGEVLPYIAEAVGMFGSVVAVDLSSRMLALAHHKYASLPISTRFLLADVEKDALAQLYDRILLLNVAPFLKHPLETLTRLYVNNLNGGGTITIAQPGGREAVNAANALLEVPTHPLPPADALAERLQDLGVKVTRTEDTDDMYLITIRRR